MDENVGLALFGAAYVGYLTCFRLFRGNSVRIVSYWPIYNLKRTYWREKLSEMWDSGEVMLRRWSIFHHVVFNVVDRVLNTILPSTLYLGNGSVLLLRLINSRLATTNVCSLVWHFSRYITYLMHFYLPSITETFRSVVSAAFFFIFYFFIFFSSDLTAFRMWQSNFNLHMLHCTEKLNTKKTVDCRL